VADGNRNEFTSHTRFAMAIRIAETTTGVEGHGDCGSSMLFRCICCGLLVALLGGALWIRVSAAQMNAMTSDEGFTWRLIQFSWSEVLTRTAEDVHPPLHSLIAKVWGAAFGKSLFSLRVLSSLFSVVAVVLIYWIGRSTLERLGASRLRSETGGFLAAVALAMHPLQIEIGSTARMYPLGVFLVLLSTAFLQQIQLERARRPLFAGLYAIAAAALCYTHNYGLVVVASQAVYAIAFYAGARDDDDRSVRQALLGAFVLAGALYLPWVAATTRQAAILSRGYWIENLTYEHATELISAWFLGSASGIWLPPMPRDEKMFALVVLVGIACAALFRGSREHVQVLAEAYGPWVAVILVFIALGQSFALLRCFSFALASLILLMIFLIPIVPSTFGRAVVTAVFFLPMLWHGTEAVVQMRSEWDANAAVVEDLVEAWQRDDVLVVRSVRDVNVLLYHAAAAGVEDFDVRCLTAPFKDRNEHWVHVASFSDEQFITNLSALTPDMCGRMWILTHSLLPQKENLMGWQIARSWRYPGGATLALYEPETGDARLQGDDAS
jgi:hypothetical protein